MHASTLDDNHSTIMQGYHNKKKTIGKLKEELAKNERELATILQRSDASNTRLAVSRICTF